MKRKRAEELTYLFPNHPSLPSNHPSFERWSLPTCTFSILVAIRALFKRRHNDDIISSGTVRVHGTELDGQADWMVGRREGGRLHGRRMAAGGRVGWWTGGQVDGWAGRQMGRWTGGQSDGCTVERKDDWRYKLSWTLSAEVQTIVHCQVFVERTARERHRRQNS